MCLFNCSKYAPLVFRWDTSEEYSGSARVYVVVDPPSPGPQCSIEGFLSCHLHHLSVPLEMIPPACRWTSRGKRNLTFWSLALRACVLTPWVCRCESTSDRCWRWGRQHRVPATSWAAAGPAWAPWSGRLLFRASRGRGSRRTPLSYYNSVFFRKLEIWVL